MRPKIIPSVLTADWTRLGDEVADLADAGVDRIHWDVMDGRYVPNITLGPDIIKACRAIVDIPFEVHVMCDRPEEMLPRYIDAGCELVLLHPETLRQPHHTYSTLPELGARAGLALAPSVPLVTAQPLLELVDLLLVMTVNPGFGGQSYLSSMEPKVAAARALIDASGRDVELEVDGGVGPDTIVGAAVAGADVFVCGSALWRYPSFGDAVGDLRERALAVSGG